MKRIFLMLAIVLLFSYSVSALASLGVSPANKHFSQVLRGGYASEEITIGINSEELEEFQLESWGVIADWINLSETKVYASLGNPAKVLVSINPPIDTPNGNYTGFVRIGLTSAGKAGDGQATSVIRAVLDFAITVEVVDLELYSCDAKGFSVQHVEKGDDLVFKANVKNNGNIRIRPAYKVKIWDAEQIEVIKEQEAYGENIFPTLGDTLTLRMSTDDLNEGQYWAEVFVLDCESNDLLSVDVLTPGSLYANGEILFIVGRKNASIGETVPFFTLFKNTGEKEFSARFRGQISLDGSPVQVIESEEIMVYPGEVTNFSFFFTPEKRGKYIVGGRVFYEKKRTFESTTSIDVYSKSSIFNDIIFYVIILLVIMFLIVVFLVIDRERRRYHAILQRK
jgi:hypothetical protein